MGKCVIAGRECPKTNNPEAKAFCPAWSDGVIWKNVQTGAEKIVHCSFEAMMPALVETIAAANRPAAAIESTRNVIAQGFAGVASVLATAQEVKALDGPSR